MPSIEVGADVRMKRALNCWPWVWSLTHSPDAVIHSPAEIVAAWPMTVTRSRWPRAFARRTQKPFSLLWKVTRSTKPASTSWVDGSCCGLICVAAVGASPPNRIWRPALRSRSSSATQCPRVLSIGDRPLVGNRPAIQILGSRRNDGAYLPWLQQAHKGAHGNADLVAHFFRRAFDLLRDGGAFQAGDKFQAWTEMAYPPVPGWLPRPSAKLQSTWLSGRARLSTVSPSRYYQSETFEWRRHFSTAASISRRNDGAFLQRVAAAVTSQVQSLSYYIDLLHNGCSGDGTDLQGLRLASGADLRTTWCTHRCR
jgi:hypothetical protein